MANIVPAQLSTPYLLGGLIVLYLGYKIVNLVRINARINKLGARAPLRKSYAPLGLDIAYEVVSHALKDKSYEMWVQMFNKWAGPGRYTIEAGIGERVILTAEPENIKAILATQFKDYGKGEQFRKDWHLHYRWHAVAQFTPAHSPSVHQGPPLGHRYLRDTHTDPSRQDLRRTGY
jgi:hypothetical protein